MSDIYMTEPPTEGKVVIKTTQGDIDVELWSKEAPLAARNFIQLAMEGYFDGSPVHRVVADFMIQMGDPTGTGKGGSSIWGRPFKDEFHSRIKFNHRGQVAMANENRPHTNQSQFFITLDACEWINRKHTIFGKVTGNTIFNVTRMGTMEVDEKDRPLDPISIKSIEVLNNPFDDIVPRDLTTVKDSNKYIDRNAIAQEEAKKSTKIKAIKNLNVLSFGDDEGEEEVFVGKLHSSHDSKQKRPKDKLIAKVAPELEEFRAPTSSLLDGNLGGNAGFDTSKGLRRQISEMNSEGDNFTTKIKKKVAENSNQSSSRSTNINGDNDNDSGSDSDKEGGDSMREMLQAENDRKLKQKVTDRNDEFVKLKDELLKSRRAVQVLTGADAENHRKQEGDLKLVSEVEQRRQKYIKRKREHGDRSKETFQKLMRFKTGLNSSKDNILSGRIKDLGDKKDEEHYHGQVLEADSDDDDDLSNWNTGKLKFKKHVDDKFRGMIGGDGRFADDYQVIDSRDDKYKDYNKKSYGGGK